MGLLAAIVVFLVGVVLAIEMDTGTLSAVQVTGIGFIATAVAFLVGVAWTWPGKT